MAVNSKELTGSPPADQTITANRSTYYGCAVREVKGTAAVATFRVRRGSASGPIIDVVELAADASAFHWLGPSGVACPDGIYFDIVAGEVEGCIFYG